MRTESEIRKTVETLRALGLAEQVMAILWVLDASPDQCAACAACDGAGWFPGRFPMRCRSCGGLGAVEAKL